MTTVTLHGDPITVEGVFPTVGSVAPDYRLVDGDLNDISLASHDGRRRLLSIVPSLDTPTCALSTKKFNEDAKARPDKLFLVCSADLPFAMKRFCGAEGTSNVISLSAMRNPIEFARSYGVLIGDGPLAGITARAVLVLDGQHKVLHAQLVGEIGDEPDYSAALAALDG